MVGHGPIEDLPSNPFATAFKPKLDNATVGLLEAPGNGVVKDLNVGVAYKGNGNPFPISMAELLNVILVKGKKIVIKDKYLNARILTEEILQLIDHSLDRVMAKVS
jgi:hypothetical protein